MHGTSLCSHWKRLKRPWFACTWYNSSIHNCSNLLDGKKEVMSIIICHGSLHFLISNWYSFLTPFIGIFLGNAKYKGKYRWNVIQIGRYLSQVIRLLIVEKGEGDMHIYEKWWLRIQKRYFTSQGWKNVLPLL